MEKFSNECKRKYFSYSHLDLWFTLACAPHLTCKKGPLSLCLKRNTFQNTCISTDRSEFSDVKCLVLEMSALTKQNENKTKPKKKLPIVPDLEYTPAKEDK